jgi:hypothetical protein
MSLKKSICRVTLLGYPQLVRSSLSTWRQAMWTFKECPEPESVESRETAVSSWETDPSEVVADCRPWWRLGRRRSAHCFKSVCSNAELVGRESSASKDVNMEAEEAAALEAVIRQPVKTQ